MKKQKPGVPGRAQTDNRKKPGAPGKAQTDNRKKPGVPGKAQTDRKKPSAAAAKRAAPPKERKPLSSAKQAALWSCGAFALTLAVMLAVFALKKVFPFGEKSLFFSDMSTEYLPFLSEFYDKVRSGGSLIYSWATALGGNAWGNLAFYASSPFNLLFLLFSRAQLPYAFAASIPLRQALGAAAMTLFLSLRRQGRPGLNAMLCGLFYACCGWFGAYYFNVMWLDAFFLLPLLLLGTERLTEGGSPRLYIPVLSLVILSNFYYGIFCCIFTALYFLYYAALVCRPSAADAAPAPRFRSALMRFALSSVFSAALLGVFLVPLLLLFRSNSALQEAHSCAAWFKNLPEQVTAFFTMHTGSGTGYAGYANAYVGILPLAALPLFFCAKRVSRREKLLSGAFLVFFFLSFNLPLLDYLWHGLRYPTALPFRQSLFFSLLLILLAHRGLEHAASAGKSAGAVSAVLGAVLLGCGIFYYVRTSSGRAITVVSLIATGVLFLFFTLLARFGEREKKAERAILAVWLTLLAVFDVGGSMFTHIGDNLQSLHSVQTEYLAEIEGLKARASDASLFYRSEMRNPSYYNNGAYYGFSGVAQASSSVDTRVLALLKNLGNDSNLYNEDQYIFQTPLFDAMMGVKYAYERVEASEEGTEQLYPRTVPEGYTRIGENKDFFSYRFSYALPLGYAVDGALASWEPVAMDAPQNQQDFFRLAANAPDLIVPCADKMLVANRGITVRDEGNHYSFTVDPENADRRRWIACTATAQRDGALYLYAEGVPDIETTFWVYVLRPGTSDALRMPYTYSTLTTLIADVKAGEKYTVYYDVGTALAGEFAISLFQVDVPALAETCAAIREKGVWRLTEKSDAALAGEITVQGDDKLFFTSIPNNDGWRITVDGEALPASALVPVGGALIAFPLSAGRHEIRMEFRLPGLLPGALLTCGAAAALGAYLWLEAKKRRARLPEQLPEQPQQA